MQDEFKKLNKVSETMPMLCLHLPWANNKRSDRLSSQHFILHLFPFQQLENTLGQNERIKVSDKEPMQSERIKVSIGIEKTDKK